MIDCFPRCVATRHLFLSHDWGEDGGNHQRVKRIAQELERRGLSVWLDEFEITGDIDEEMVRGIDSCELFVTFVTANYMKKVNQTDLRDRCKIEFKYAFQKKDPTRMIRVVLESGMLEQKNWKGIFAAFVGTSVYIDLSSDDPALFIQGIDQLEAHTRKKLSLAPAAQQQTPRDEAADHSSVSRWLLWGGVATVAVIWLTRARR